MSRRQCHSRHRRVLVIEMKGQNFHRNEWKELRGPRTHIRLDDSSQTFQVWRVRAACPPRQTGSYNWFRNSKVLWVRRCRRRPSVVGKNYVALAKNSWLDTGNFPLKSLIFWYLAFNWIWKSSPTSGHLTNSVAPLGRSHVWCFGEDRQWRGAPLTAK